MKEQERVSHHPKMTSSKNTLDIWKTAKCTITLMLFFCFIYSIYVGLERYLADRLNTIKFIDDSREKQLLPSVTMCPFYERSYYPEEGRRTKNLTELMDHVPPIERSVLKLIQKNDESDEDIIVVDEGRKILEDRLIEYLFPSNDPSDAQTLRCLQYDPWIPGRAGMGNTLEITINTTGISYMYMSLHNPGQFFPTATSFSGAYISYVNPRHNDSIRINDTHILAPTSFTTITQERFVSYKNTSSSYTCFDESDNLPSVNECYLAYVRANFSCDFPWVMHKFEVPLRPCDTAEDYAKYIDVSAGMFFSGKVGIKKVTGCRLSCKYKIIHTELKSDFDFWTVKAEKGSVKDAIHLIYYLETAEEAVTIQQLEYTRSTLMADIGGYLGLLLGGSLLSIYNYLATVGRERMGNLLNR